MDLDVVQVLLGPGGTRQQQPGSGERHDGLHRGRLDTQPLQCAPLARRLRGDHIVALEQPDLIGRQ